jgi:hypothetical protein
MFKAIVNRTALKVLQAEFEKKLDRLRPSQHRTIISHAGGSWPATVNYTDQLGIWWDLGLRRDGSQYWNAFGVGEPGSRVNIAVEINYPLKGANFNIAGNWAKDEKGKMFLFHSGKSEVENLE